MHRIWCQLLIAAVAVVAGCGGDEAPAQASAPCTIGPEIDERIVLEPRKSTFYSVDVLNPDMVRDGSRYLLFFSGNDRRVDAGRWHTGVAVADDPLGPFRVDKRLSAPFYNGGTTLRDGRFFHAASVPESHNPRLYTSRNGIRWREIAAMPGGPEGSWRAWQSDMYLQRDLRAYWVGRAGPGGADIGSSAYRDGQWRDFRQVLRRGPAGTWDAADLGEPAVFRAAGREFMLYGGLAESGQPRQIGLALRTSRGWRKCGLAIAADQDWYRANAIDPEPLVVGRRLYVYFGGGTRPSLGGDMEGRIGVRVYDLANVR